MKCLGQLEEVADLAVDSNGNVYVCDNCNDRVQKFDAGGTLQTASNYGGARDIEVDEANLTCWTLPSTKR